MRRATVAERRRRCNRAAAFAFTLLIALSAGSCSHLPPAGGAPPPAALPENRRALFALGGAGAGDTAFDRHVRTFVESDSTSTLHRVDLYRDGVALSVYSFDLYEPVGAPPPWPAVVVSPILKGGYVLERWVAGVLAPEGIAVAIPLQSEDPLPAIHSPEDLGAEFLASVRGTRAVVDWLAREESIDASRLGSVGTSLGALRNVVLLAGEPRLRANVLALGGLDVAWIFDHSREASVTRYRKERAELEGVDPSDLSRRIADAFWFHDLATARAVDGRTVLLILARFDRAVPFESGAALREALSFPETRVVPLAHYSSLLALPAIRVWLVDFFRGRFGIVRPRTPRGRRRAASHESPARDRGRR